MSTTLTTIPTPTLTASDLEREAQAAAELRLEAAYMVLEAQEFDTDEDYGPSQEDLESAEAVLAGPFCGCNTCVIREVLDASYDQMLALARLELAQEQAAAHELAAAV